MVLTGPRADPSTKRFSRVARRSPDVEQIGTCRTMAYRSLVLTDATADFTRQFAHDILRLTEGRRSLLLRGANVGLPLFASCPPHSEPKASTGLPRWITGG